MFCCDLGPMLADLFCGNNVCHGESFARSGYTQQCLMWLSFLYPFCKLTYGFWLITCRLVSTCKFEIHALVDVVSNVSSRHKVFRPVDRQELVILLIHAYQGVYDNIEML